MKKSYNPFKMVLPYFGALFGFFLNSTQCPFIECGLAFQNVQNVSFTGLIIGFLLGWGIQSLWRAFKK